MLMFYLVMKQKVLNITVSLRVSVLNHQLTPAMSDLQPKQGKKTTASDKYYISISEYCAFSLLCNIFGL